MSALQDEREMPSHESQAISAMYRFQIVILPDWYLLC